LEADLPDGGGLLVAEVTGQRDLAGERPFFVVLP